MTGIEKIRADLDWRGPNGKPMGHVVLSREQAEQLLNDLPDCPHCHKSLKSPTGNALEILIEDYPWPKITGPRIRAACHKFWGDYPVLQEEHLKTFGDLCRKTEAQVLRQANIGKQSINDVKTALATVGLRLGMLP